MFWSGAPQPAAPLAPTPCPVSFPISPSPAHSIPFIPQPFSFPKTNLPVQHQKDPSTSKPNLFFFSCIVNFLRSSCILYLFLQTEHSLRASFYASKFDSSSHKHFVSHHALHDLIILEEIHRPAALSSQHYRKQIFLSNKPNTTTTMSGKLDQSLDEILSTQRRSAGGPGRRSQRRSTGGRPAAAAPVGGVQKTSRPARGAAANKPNAAKPAQGSGDSKVIVSNLPKDVNEQQIKVCCR